MNRINHSSRFIELFGNPVTNTKSWPTKSLSEVAPESPSTNKATGQVWVLNLDMVESQSGRVIEKVYDNVENLNSVAPFDDGNVLFSKLRPYLNKVVIPNGQGYATTELVPLRPDTNIVRKEFLACLLRSNDFVNYADAIATGTKMPRMPMTALRAFKCINPPLDMQNEFIKVSQQSDKSKFNGFKSRFFELMQVGYTQKSLCSICRPRQWPTIQTKDFTNDGYLVYGANGIIGRYREYNHEDRTILMACRGASCGAINISEPKSYITGNAMCLDELSDEINFDYLAYFLSCYDYSQIITGGAQPQITYTNLTKVLVPVPDMTDQDSFVIVLQQADKSKYLN